MLISQLYFQNKYKIFRNKEKKMQSVPSLPGQLKPCGKSSFPQIDLTPTYSFNGYYPPQSYGNFPSGTPSNIYPRNNTVDNYLASNSPRMGNYSPRNVPQIISVAPKPQSIFSWLFSF